MAHKKALLGTPATGKKVTVTGMNFYRLEGGKIVEEFYFEDSLGLMRQLDLIPPRE